MDHIDRHSPSTSNMPSFKCSSWSSGKRTQGAFCWLFAQGWFSFTMTTNTHFFQKKCNLYSSCAFSGVQSEYINLFITQLYLSNGNSHIQGHPADVNISGITLDLKGQKWRKRMMLFTCDQDLFPTRLIFCEENPCFSFAELSNQNMWKTKVFYSLLRGPA